MLYICSNFVDVIEWTGFRASGERGVQNFCEFIERSRERTRQVHSEIVRAAFVCRNPSDEDAQTLLSFVFLSLEDGAKMGALRVDM
jgi:hypothetical protein